MFTKSFWIAGFECSSHRRRDGRRLDLIAATGHDRWAARDYARLRQAGIETARDGLRWHLIERSAGQYDPSSLLPLVHAARDAGVQVIWDLCHYGWPEEIDLFRPQFVDRFAAYARTVARWIAAETDEPPVFVPVNEISFWCWAGGDTAFVDPYERRRGFELKTQLVRASLAAVDAIWSVAPKARILHPDPSIHILPRTGKPGSRARAEGYRQAQYQAWDMLAGRLWPQLGGDERYLDIVGVDYYPYNQWIYRGATILRDDPRYRPFRELLAEVWERYRRPLLISETGSQGDDRAPWLAYVGEEVRAAIRQGIPVQGICLYPILDYPEWKDGRHRETGLWGFPDAQGERPLHHPLAWELERQQELFQRGPLQRDSSRKKRSTMQPDLVCFSHLRWDFVYQRPQHLMSRFAQDRRVFFVEEPVFGPGGPRLELRERGGVRVAVPRLPEGTDPVTAESLQAELLRGLLTDHDLSDYILWYYTPMAVAFTEGLDPVAVIYDCMDELSLFRGAPPELVDREERLLARADLVFTGGQSLYEAKRGRHPSVHAFPSSIDHEHFRRARKALRPRGGPGLQAAIPHPRLGYFGVIDERMDLDLLAAVADARPAWQLILLGPVVKIDPAQLPRRPNLHFVGMKTYRELPAWLAGWDVALMPFALNESTRFISPTKTPEYLAGGRPVVSTPIRDVVRPYGEMGLVEIAGDAEAFVAAAERLLALAPEARAAWLRRVDEFLAQGSWGGTWRQMSDLVDETVAARRGHGVPEAERSTSTCSTP